MLDQLHLSPSEFADRIGVQRSNISHILSGRNKPSIDFLEKILNEFPETDVSWLITGRISSPVTYSGPVAELKSEVSQSKDQLAKEIEIKKPAQGITEPVEKIIIVYKNNTFKVLNPSEYW